MYILAGCAWTLPSPDQEKLWEVHMRGIGRHSVVVGGHKTNISIEDKFWEALEELAATRDLSPRELVEEIDREKGDSTLSSAIRVYLLGVYKAQHKPTPPASETEVLD